MTQEYTGTRTHERSNAGSEARERAGEAYEGAKTAVRTAYDKTADAYQRTMRYGNKHPQQFSMFAFMAGVGAGALLAGRYTNHSRTERLASPLIDAFAEMARAFVRR